MKYFAILLLILAAVLPTLGQDSTARTPKNTVFLEYGSAGIRYSLNYERRLVSLWHNRIGIEASVGYCSWKFTDYVINHESRITVLPFRLQASYTTGRHTVFAGVFSLGYISPICSVSHHTGQWECSQDVEVFRAALTNPYMGYTTRLHRRVVATFTLTPIYYTINRNLGSGLYFLTNQKYVEPTSSTPFDKSGTNYIRYPDLYRRKVIPWLGASVGYRF